MLGHWLLRICVKRNLSECQKRPSNWLLRICVRPCWTPSPSGGSPSRWCVIITHTLVHACITTHTLVHAYFTTHAVGVGALAGDDLFLHTYLVHAYCYLLHMHSEWSEPLQVMMSGKPNVYLMCIYRVPNVYLLRVKPLQVMIGKPNVYPMCIYCVPKKGHSFYLLCKSSWVNRKTRPRTTPRPRTFWMQPPSPSRSID